VLKRAVFSAIALSVTISSSGYAQGMFEGHMLKGLSAGAGAGTAAAVAGNSKPPDKNAKSPVMSKDEIDRRQREGEQLQKAGNLADAEKCFRLSLSSLSKSKGADCEQGMALLEKLSEVCASQHKFDDAAGFHTTILANTKKQFGAEDHRTILVQHRLADILTEKGDHAGAAKHLGEAFTNAEKLSKPLDNGKMIEMLDSYAIALRGLGRESEASDVERKATELYAAGTKKAQ
jgi:tetratricopeptide (TPR) repeat protein